MNYIYLILIPFCVLNLDLFYENRYIYQTFFNFIISLNKDILK